MLSDFIAPAGAAQSHEDKPPRSVLRYRVEKQWKNAVKKCTKTIKKQAKNLHKRKTCIIFVSNSDINVINK